MTRGRNPFDPLDGPIDHVLDLHGMNSVEAQVRVTSFLQTNARRRPGALLHIVTGRGRGSVAGPVLRPLVKRLLTGELARFVAAMGRDVDDGGFVVRLR